VHEVARKLSTQLELQPLLQTLTDAATRLAGAAYGAFFYNAPDAAQGHYLLFTLSGAPRETFEALGMPRNTALFEPTFSGRSVVRLADVKRDPRFGRSAPGFGMPPGHLSVTSYLAVPVIGRGGQVEGGLFLGHPRPGVFTEASERIVVRLAAQAAIAIDNARLYERERQARAHAEAASRAKDEFLSLLSHELRTPLASVLGWAAVLRSDVSGERTAQAVEAIERCGRAQARLIDDLLDVSRMVSGRMHLELRPVDLAAVLRSALDTARPAAAARSIRIEADLPPSLELPGDAERLEQMAGNLLSNAVKFTPPGGHIELRLEQRDGLAHLAVSDDGRGISPEFLPFVFERFQQADHAHTRSTRGLGLGLTIVRHLAELHGGSAAVQSDGEGKGATFSVTLPLGPRAPDPPR
jgi:signal transduction histidine kinase